MPQAADRAARLFPPAQETFSTTPRVSYRSELFISIISLGQNVKQNSYLLSLGYHPTSGTPSFQFLCFGDYCRTLPETSVGSIWISFRQLLQLYRAEWPGVSPACLKSCLLWWENSLFGAGHTFFYNLDSCGFQASELCLFADLRKNYSSPHMYVCMSLHSCILTPLPGTSSLTQAGLIAEPKAVPTCLSEGAFKADFLTNLGARIECGSPSRISYLHFPSLLFCSPSLIVEYSYFILCL